jgi:protein ImuB
MTPRSSNIRSMIAVVHLPRLPLLVAMLRARRPLDMAAALAPAPGAPQVIGLCTDAAEAEGVRPGLRVGEAHARCPHLALIAPHPEGAIEAIEQMMARLEAAGCAVEQLGPEDIALDIRPVLRLHGGPKGVLAQVRRALPVGADGRIGVGPGIFIAHQAARHAGNGVPRIVDRRDAAAFLSPLPVDRLPLTDAACERCREVGLTRIGQVAALPRAAALERLGFDGIGAWELARGMPDRPLRPRTPPRPVSAHIDFADPADTLPMLQSACRLLVERIAAAVRVQGRSVRTLTLSATLADGGSWARRVTLREATAEGARLELAVNGRLTEIASPVSGLRISADTSGSAGGRQLTALPSPHEERAARTHEAVRHVRAALGDDALLRVIELDPSSHIPERRFALAPHPDIPMGRP